MTTDFPGGDPTVLELTETTIETVKSLAASSGMSGLRIFTDPRSEEELTLSAALVDSPAEGDEVVEDDGAYVYLDPPAAEVLDRKLLDAHVAEGRVHLSLLDRS